MNKIDTPKNIVSSSSLLKIANRMLYNINKKIVVHNERTAFLVLSLAKNYNLNKKYSLQDLVILSLFHTIGFFREDIFVNYSPTDSVIDFFTNKKATNSKYTFGCYYLEFMTPLKKIALAIEYFTEPFNSDLKKYIYQEECKSFIYFSARISEYLDTHSDKDLPEDLNSIAPDYFDPEIVEVFNKVNKHNQLVQKIRNGSYVKELSDYIDTIKFSEEDNSSLLKLLVYILDFKSTVTMQHSINTSCYALSLGTRYNLQDDEISILYTSAILHDVGKIAMSKDVLEYPGKLSMEDMQVMKTHVTYSKKILTNLVDEQIISNVSNHHEKLNGKGYPNNLKQNQLNQMERILTICDITSALTDSRSYKGEFSKDTVLKILKEMSLNKEIDSDITQAVCAEYDQILKERDELQNILKVDFRTVIQKYNEYLFSSTFSLMQDIGSEENAESIEELAEEI